MRSVLPAGQSFISQETVNEALADGGRFSIINVWRTIAEEPVEIRAYDSGLYYRFNLSHGDIEDLLARPRRLNS